MSNRTYGYIVAALDLVILVSSTLLAIIARTSSPFLDRANDFSELVFPVAGPIALMWFAMLSVRGAYDHRQWGSGIEEYRQVLSASMATMALLGVTAFLFQYPLSRGYFFMLFLIGIPALLIGRYAARVVLHRQRQRGKCLTPLLIAGSPATVTDLLTVVRRESWLGYDTVGVLLSGPEQGWDDPFVPNLGDPSNVVQIVDEVGAHAVIFTTGSVRRGTEFNELARRLERHRAQMVVVPAITDISAHRIKISPVAGIPLMYVDKPQAERALSRSKRTFDFIVTALGVIVISPLLAVTALVVKLGDGGPVLFKQARVGQGGREFNCLKFRSMVVDAEQIRADQLAHLNESDGALFKMKDDPRITRVGRFIRRYSIDELPQLFNVLKGEMSLVGPRPALPAEVLGYKSHVRRRLDVRPGITGLWQVSGRSDLSWDDTVRLDLYYVDNWSMLQDVTILIKTVRAVLSSRGAY